MKNVTITVDEEVARWARVKAAELDISLARFVGDMLRERMTRERDYERAMRISLALQPEGGSKGRKLPTRDDVHDRAALRR